MTTTCPPDQRAADLARRAWQLTLDADELERCGCPGAATLRAEAAYLAAEVDQLADGPTDLCARCGGSGLELADRAAVPCPSCAGHGWTVTLEVDR